MTIYVKEHLIPDEQAELLEQLELASFEAEGSRARVFTPEQHFAEIVESLSEISAQQRSLLPLRDQVVELLSSFSCIENYFDRNASISWRNLNGAGSGGVVKIAENGAFAKSYHSHFSEKLDSQTGSMRIAFRNPRHFAEAFISVALCELWKDQTIPELTSIGYSSEDAEPFAVYHGIPNAISLKEYAELVHDSERSLQSLRQVRSSTVADYYADQIPTEEHVFFLIIQLADLVDRFHQSGWVHNDIKDKNIITNGVDLMIIDLETARPHGYPGIIEIVQNERNAPSAPSGTEGFRS